MTDVVSFVSEGRIDWKKSGKLGAEIAEASAV
jgi:hypothetical protein